MLFFIKGNLKFILLLLIIIFVAKGSTLICNYCQAINKKICDVNEKEVECSSSEKSCMTAFYKDADIPVYIRRCHKSVSCLDFCKKIPDDKKDCKVNCCFADKCNVGLHDEIKSHHRRNSASGSRRFSVNIYSVVICLFPVMLLLKHNEMIG